MRLDQYLTALENCPDELLKKRRDGPLWRATAELGVYDNWPILLNTDFESVLHHLESSDFTLFGRGKDKKHTYVRANYNPGTVELKVWDCVWPGWAVSKMRSQEHYKRQMGNFTMGMMLHPYQEKKMGNVSSIKALSIVIGIIGKLALERDIPLCFTKSRGWDNLNDYSQIVYHP